ncbi:RNA polymerase sigma factor [Streptomyces pathocidini]|uniref:RNA polymerase sigma factor n=1 Tax=Streptomyces pathocidini TaxID=1650571 RepID=A0ABW7UQX1_9ACTN|nr:sigma-70 family RNA polymerase sigma factor [Streptomyces pathocidini]
MTGEPSTEDLLRSLAPQVLGALVRRYGHFDTAEDAVQEALLAAATQWPEEGRPANPRGWLIRVASRRLTDLLRSEQARRRREETAAALTPPDELLAPAPGQDRAPSADDTLTLLFLCCHPYLTPAAQIALTLRAVGGLTTAEIARAHLVPEATMAQRISRAKQRVRAAGSRFRRPEDAEERHHRLKAALHVLYLIFNEGYTATSGRSLQRVELSREAIRLTRAVRELLPEDGEVAGLLALMLLTDARRPARTRPDGSLVPLAEQDRGLWDRELIEEGGALVTGALSPTGTGEAAGASSGGGAGSPPGGGVGRPLGGGVGPYQVQAAIAAVHDEAARAEDTDWDEILGLYEVLAHLDPNPMVTLNQAVALAMVRGPRAGLALLETLDADSRMAGHHRLEAVRGHLLEMAGDRAAALAAYQRAADRTLSLPERRYLQERAARLAT